MTAKFKNSKLDLIASELTEKGAVQRMSGAGGISWRLDAIPSGSLGLDIALGIMGFPRGRIIEIFGPESSGKSTLALATAVACQRKYDQDEIGIVDAEHAMSAKYASDMGLDLDRTLINQPDCGEEGIETVEAMVDKAKLPLVIVDSVAALVPKAELEGEVGDQQIALQARLMSKAMRRLVGMASKSNSCIIFINQIREKPGTMFGSPEVQPGGRALKFAASVRVDIRKIGTTSDKDKKQIANTVRAKVVKNKIAPPFREAEFMIFFGQGVDFSTEILALGVHYGVLSLAGPWYKDEEGRRVANGREAMLKLLREDETLRNGFRDQIVQKAKG